ncbi:alpha/beta fold hydrolase [Glutamicibacter protophormiae]|uniref:alpha/beta fold hydrolase n=1 Tax=Glutamicibacter protophormiae TaxID=37930 RepID=UPI003A8CEE09
MDNDAPEITTPTIAFIHGAWSNSGSWEPLRTLLEAGGAATVSLDLPSVDRGDGAELGDMHADAEAIRSLIDGIAGPVVAVAHSYGGVPTTEALAGAKNVAHVIYVAAFMLDKGQSLLGAVGGKEPPVWRTSDDGRLVELADPVHVIYPDCPPDVAEAAAAQLLPHARIAFTQELRAACWHDIPTTYVVCDNDVAVPPQAQEGMAQHARAVRHLASAHTPFLSHTAELAAVIQETVASLPA